MRAISGRDASCRATSLPIPALAPVINTDFTGVVLIVIASLLVEVQPGLAERCGPAAGRIPAAGPCSAWLGPAQRRLPSATAAGLKILPWNGTHNPIFGAQYGMARPIPSVSFCRCLRGVLGGG